MMKKVVQIRDIVIGEGVPKICIPVVGKTEEEIIHGMQKAIAAHADLIEWRGDFYEAVFNEEAVLSLLNKIRALVGNTVLLFTFRTLAEGGNCDISLQDYHALNRRIAKSGLVDLVDVESNREDSAFPLVPLIDAIHEAHGKVILSKHDFEKTPEKEEMEQYLQQGDAMHADIVKLAVMPNAMEDVLRLLEVTTISDSCVAQPLITMSMGAMGSVSRACGEYFGSAVTFGTAGEASAPGQFDSQKLRTVLDIFHEGSKGL